MSEGRTDKRRKLQNVDDAIDDVRPVRKRVRNSALPSLGDAISWVWSSTAPEGIQFNCDAYVDEALRCSAMGVAGLGLLDRTSHSERISRATLCRYDLSAASKRSGTSLSSVFSGALLLGVVAVLPSQALRAAVLFGAAVNSAYQGIQDAIAWHHFVLLETSKSIYLVELLRGGVHVRAVIASDDRTSSEAQQHRQQLKFQQVMNGSSIVAEEIHSFDLDMTVQKWLRYVLNDKYDLVKWNCQHFSQDLMAVCAAYRV
jgi:hypothetical protein